MKLRDLGALLIKVVNVAWMAIALGVGMELFVLAVLLLTGKEPAALGVAINVLSRVSWSVIVCAALAVSTALPRGAVPLSGLTGLLVAPGATLFAKVLQKFLLEALTNASMALSVPLILGLAALRAVEYLLLGAALAWLGGRGSGFLAAVAVGTATGVLFGACATGLTAVVAGVPDLPLLVAGLLNEVLFPVGCAVVLYGAERLARLFVPLEPEGAAAVT